MRGYETARILRATFNAEKDKRKQKSEHETRKDKRLYSIAESRLGRVNRDSGFVSPAAKFTFFPFVASRLVEWESTGEERRTGVSVVRLLEKVVRTRGAKEKDREGIDRKERTKKGNNLTAPLFANFAPTLGRIQL